MAAGFILLNAIEQYYADDNKADPAKVLSPDSDMISECQKKLFENACINNIRFREDYNDLLDNSMMACCDVFNALLYYNIIVAWGDFPYAENSSAALDRENAVRNNSRNILTALADDLEKAMACLEDKRYPYDDPDESMSVSKDIARILLADIHMYLGEYSKAGTLLKQVIDSGYYSLEGNGSVILGLYAGIPFCPSVCSYCSFSSSPIDKWRDRVDVYLDALEKELRALGKMAQGRRPDTVYIGGGTPTTLEPDQLERLLCVIEESFDLGHVLEFTVEAGRPDSITEEKLRVLKNHPVTRISVNPQTMQQKTLDLVGRKHTVEQTVEAFRMARSMGFDNINMDLIAGLPGETVEDMQDTLAQIEALAPDSLTVHALAIKRAARFGQEGRTANLHEEISALELITLLYADL